MSEDAFAANGHCRCGAVRFRVAAAPTLTEFCHCESCRRSAGAPLMAWAGIRRDAFAITEGEPVGHESTPGVVRTFCGRCGTSLTLADQRFAEEVYVAIAAFDDPDLDRLSRPLPAEAQESTHQSSARHGPCDPPSGGGGQPQLGRNLDGTAPGTESGPQASQ